MVGVDVELEIGKRVLAAGIPVIVPGHVGQFERAIMWITGGGSAYRILVPYN